MKTQQRTIKEYVLEENDLDTLVVKGALEYCRHRIRVHQKCKHLSLEAINKLLSEFKSL